MSPVISPHFNPANITIAIIVAKFNEVITKKLLAGAQDYLKEVGVKDERIDIAFVPGAFEIPLLAKTFTNNPKYDCVICLGAVIRGETPHFDYIAAEAARGIQNTALSSGKPVIFGVLTCDNMKQALARAGKKDQNKGYEAAKAATEMVSLLQTLK